MKRELLRGMMLPELLVIVVLVGMLAVFAVPSLTQLVESNRSRALTELLRATLIQARTHSILSNRDVRVCGSSDGLQCDGDWQRGWLVLDSSDAPLSSHQLATYDQLHWLGFANEIRFRRNGTAPLGNGRFVICQRSRGVGWQLILNRQGRIRGVAGLESGQTPPAVCP